MQHLAVIVLEGDVIGVEWGGVCRVGGFVFCRRFPHGISLSIVGSRCWGSQVVGGRGLHRYIAARGSFQEVVVAELQVISLCAQQVGHQVYVGFVNIVGNHHLV